LSDYELDQLRTAYGESMRGEEERAENERVYLLYGPYEPLTVKCTHVLNRQAGIAWTSYSHTGVPVPTSAIGAGAGHFDGYYDNTDIHHKVKAAMAGAPVPK
jgi:alkaline phosphatase